MSICKAGEMQLEECYVLIPRWILSSFLVKQVKSHFRNLLELMSSSCPQRKSFPRGMQLPRDPIRMLIKALPFSSTLPSIYTLTKSLLYITSMTPIDMWRTNLRGGELTFYVIGERFISAMHTGKRDLQHITAPRSHGLLVSVRLRKIICAFVTHVPEPKSSFVDLGSSPVDPGCMIGTVSCPGTVQKRLLRFMMGCRKMMKRKLLRLTEGAMRKL